MRRYDEDWHTRQRWIRYDQVSPYHYRRRQIALCESKREVNPDTDELDYWDDDDPEDNEGE